MLSFSMFDFYSKGKIMSVRDYHFAPTRAVYLLRVYMCGCHRYTIPQIFPFHISKQVNSRVNCLCESHHMELDGFIQ
jgi:hypothetical protein